MTKDQIIARRDALVADRARALEEIQQLEALRHTQHGAIQECEYWLRVVAAEEERALGAAKGEHQRAGVLAFRGQTDDVAEVIGNLERLGE